MSNPKMAPCPKCQTTDHLSVYSYEQSGNAKHVECDKCFYLGPAAGSVRKAIKLHNDKIELAAINNELHALPWTEIL